MRPQRVGDWGDVGSYLEDEILRYSLWGVVSLKDKEIKHLLDLISYR